MVALSSLWLPILLSAVFVFIASSIIHMVLQYHKTDYRPIPGEPTVLATLREQRIAPGDYVFPQCSSMNDMGKPEMIEKWKTGPVGFLTVVPGGTPSMGKSLGQWFAYTVMISFFVAYIGTLSLPPAAEYKAVFRLTGTVAILAYAFSNATNSIWKGVLWSSTAKYVVDGVVYGLVTAGTFGWLWPDA